MYLQIASEHMLSQTSIIGIFDLDKTTTEVKTKQFLSKTEQENRLYNVANDLPKTFIVTSENIVYFTHTTTQTLQKRFNDMVEYKIKE